MKHFVLVGTLCLILIQSQFVIANYNQRFTLKCNIKGLKDGTSVYLIKNAGTDIIATTKSLDGHFLFNGEVKGGTDFFYLRLDSTIGKQRSSEFLLINGALELDGDLSDWPKVNLKGSDANDDFLTISDMFKNLKEPERTTRIKMLLRERSGSLYLPYVVLKMNISDPEKVEFYDKLTADSKNSFFGKQLFEKVNLIQKKAHIIEASFIPDIKVTLLTGEKVDIRALVAKSKFTLIDFWASWCGPCRQESANLKKVYAAFKENGFNILGVALNDKELDWKKTVADDQIAWTQTRDTENICVKKLSIPYLPAFILLDRQGKLVAYDCPGSEIDFGPGIRGNALYQTIKKLLTN